MGLINFEKPKKVLSTEDHNKQYSSDSGVNGTYVPNMSKEDRYKWKGKHIKGNNERVEVRKTFHGCNVLIIVYKLTSYIFEPNKYNRNPPTFDIHISTNGAIKMTLSEYDELTKIIDECKEILSI